MEGFFNQDQSQSDNISKKGFKSCVSCGLYKHVLSPKIKPYGKFKKKVMLIGEAPEKVEDERGKAWQGDMGKVLKTALGTLGFNLFRDGISLNACNCRPPGNATPEDFQIECCRKKVMQAIEKHKPKVIILLGNAAIKSVIGKYWKKDIGGVTKWRGFQIPDQNFESYVCPVFHPSFVERSKDQRLIKKIWLNDLKAALNCIKKPTPKRKNYSKFLTFIETDKQYTQMLSKLKKSKRFVIDIETTGLRPYKKGHKILLTGVAVSSKEAYVWQNNPKWDKQFAKILRNKKIKKIAQNIPFEDLWFNILIGKVNGWEWCTQSNTHILDNRHGVTGLKFQTYVRFGVADYDSDVNPYIQSVDKKKYGKNAFNRLEEYIKKYGVKRPMEYCGLDNIFTFMLYELQKERFKVGNS